MKLKPQLVSHWRLIFRQWSFWLTTVGTALTGVLIASPDWLLQVWAMLPDDLKAAIPAQYKPLIGVGIALLGVAAKFVKQAKLELARIEAQAKTP